MREVEAEPPADPVLMCARFDRGKADAAVNIDINFCIVFAV